MRRRRRALFNCFDGSKLFTLAFETLLSVHL